MVIIGVLLCVVMWVLATEALMWTITMSRHACWLKRHPEYEAGLATKARTLQLAISLSGLFCLLVGCFFVYFTTLLATGMWPINYIGIIGISLIPGVFLTHIHLWSIVARYTCLHTQYWPLVSLFVHKTLSKHINIQDLAVYCLSYERWRSILPLADTHNKLLPTFLDVIPEVLWIKDKSGRLTYANRMTFKKLGFDEARVLGRTFYEMAFTHTPDLLDVSFYAQSEKADLLVLKTKKVFRGNIYGRILGKFCALKVTKAPVYTVCPETGEKELSGVICLGIDITERWHEHEEILELFEEGRVSEGINAFVRHKTHFELISGDEPNEKS